ncbi:energy transducer TonB [uncultured Flavobacterium sp.]|uniref:energy transducer TonB family protein n=1 Tax=uncultured Flavobacterium sp. TaxID=165435 RepID=UPI0025FFF6A0|nr:energy transducer TonB [uncultured Flavobacterium sp.]
MEKITKEEKHSAMITGIIFLSLFLPLVFFTYTVTYPDPLTVMLEGGGGGGGVTINFGDSDMGMGANYRSELLEAASKVKSEPVSSATAEEVVGSDDEESEAVANTKPVEKKDPRLQNAKTEPPKQQPSKAAMDALSNFSNSVSKDGDGDDNVSGNKGDKNGDKNSSNYYDNNGEGDGKGNGKGNGKGDGEGDGEGNGKGGGKGNGIGTGVGDYRLDGRKPITRPKPQYKCNEQGTVTVQITVDRKGKVIKVDRGRPTTNSAQCLYDQARQAAFDTKFESSASAPEKQTGTIVYNFKLTE